MLSGQMELQVSVSRKYPFTNFKKQYSPKSSGCCIVNCFERFWLGLRQEAHCISPTPDVKVTCLVLVLLHSLIVPDAQNRACKKAIVGFKF